MTPRPRSLAQSGSTLAVTLVTLSALSIMAALTLIKATPNIHIAYQNAAWQEARVAAESGIDTAMNDLMLNATGFAPGEWTGWEEEKPKGSKNPLAQPLKLLTGNKVEQLINQLARLTKLKKPKTSKVPLPPEPVIESASLFLDNVRVSARKGIPSQVDIQLWALEPQANPHTRWYRIRAMGTCALPPTAHRPPAAMDSPLRRFSLRHVRESLRRDDVGTAMAVPLPNISRTVEALVEPIAGFELALWTGDPIQLPNTGTWNIDSFDSRDDEKSDLGLYPGRGAAKVQSNGNIASSALPLEDHQPLVRANGTQIQGAVGTNGGDDPTTEAHENISGGGGIDPNRVHDTFIRKMIPAVRPDGEFIPSPPGGLFLAGPVTAPTIYSVHGDVRDMTIYSPAVQGDTAVVILIDGDLDLAKPLNIPPTTVAVLYVKGNITFRGAVNAGPKSSNRAAQLLIFADNPKPRQQLLTALGSIPICAAFYGPGAIVALDGAVHWMGSLNALSLRVSSGGAGGIHYDEALGTVGPTVGFRISRFIEDVRQ